MSSHSAGATPRRVPCQPRGRRRVRRLLRAAENEISRTGYDAATMCAIARRAGSSVGSLYQFFPNKSAVVEALRAGYLEQCGDFWTGLALDAPALGPRRLAARLLAFPLAFAAKHPAFLALLDLPPTAQCHVRRELIRDRIAAALRAGRPRLSPAKAARIAAVVHQIIRACLALYARADARQRARIVAEFHTVLAAYLAARLGKAPAPRTPGRGGRHLRAPGGIRR